MSKSSVSLIDADSNLTAHLTDELSRYGLVVEAFTDANDVMGRKDELPALIVLCIDPKRTGWAVCNRLRKSASLKSVPLIITSAEATEKDFEDHKKLKTRAEDYLHKPFGVEALIEKIGTLIGLPEEPNEPSMIDIPVDADSDEIAIEDDGMVVEDEVEEQLGFDAPQPDSSSGFVAEDSQDRTRIGVMNIDDEVNNETDAAFAAIGMEPDESDNTSTNILPAHELEPPRQGVKTSGVNARTLELPSAIDAVPPGLADPPTATDDPYDADSPFDGPPALPDVEPEPMPPSAKQPSVDLDLGLDAVAQQAISSPRPRRHSSPSLVTSTAQIPAAVTEVSPINDTSAHDTSASMMAEVKAERDRLRREVEELRNRPAAKAEPTPGAAGFSREREFLNLREIINKKEKEILDLRDSLDAKERQILDSKDKLRELERRSRDLDEKALATERELVGAKEKIEALSHDKERVVEREKQVKGRLDDALKTVARYEQEIEAWKKRHAEDIAALEQSYNDTVAAHQSEVQELKTRHASATEALNEQHAGQMRETLEQHEGEKSSMKQSSDQERARLEAEHAQAVQHLRETKDNEREGLRLRFESQISDLTEQHQVEVQGLHEQYAGSIAQLKAEHEAQAREQSQLHNDELSGLRARHTQDTKTAERKHAEEVQKLHEHEKQELAKAEERRMQELSVKDEEHRAELEQVAREHLVEKGRIERENEAALQAMDERANGLLQQAADAAAAELARVTQALEQQKADELKQARDTHMRKMQALEESHADLKAGMQQRHASQLEEIGKQHAQAVAELEGELKQRVDLIAEGNAKVSELEEQLRGEREKTQRNDLTLAELQQALATAKNDIAEREQKLADRQQRIGDLEQESAGYQDQILKAYQRIKSDESIVSRAKKALAIALTLLDESNADGSDEATS
jgi:hypothetical protein